VAVGFDAGNLAKVAKALRKLHPHALIVVCGDDDRDTEARTGVNGGRVGAERAAQAVGGLAIYPQGLPEGGSDFNDLHAHEGGPAGLDAVRAIVQGSIDAHQRPRRTHRPRPGIKAMQGPSDSRNAPAAPPAPHLAMQAKRPRIGTASA